MSFKFALPLPALQPYIKQYWAVENVLEKGVQHTQRIIPTGLPELVFYFGSRPSSDERNLDGNSLLNGQQNDYYDLIITDRLSVFSVTFQPDGLSHFLKIPLIELKNQTVVIDNIGFPVLRHLEYQLAESKDFNTRVRIAENCFLQLLAQQPVSVDHQRMRHAVEQIRSARALVSIDLLASDSCLSRKHFERKFLYHIGISPKQFLKIIRFQNAIHIKQTTGTSLTELAYIAGYYDQSHLINETKELTGQTPKKFFGTREITSDFFL